ncbi:DUF6782 family putative metallopeptidase [Cellulomonas dongxiuzhuiae]|uniref:DUF4157 domain-containing protein n=1 Tax=Cellulomonas dongxiuzhuiae TaxID=2819979 RepID=A0ABX8GNN1_9CELL|nr:DUF6782 family putative metallopeptidase [Cellulomonas dongxiuzhuiae]MBO3095977.1 hypothetical protein [Cellulomonas dongxiuzhuiae]QWC17266.1 hypothetical protein KKR89_06685 [Cellulomonas dongxiuzhuiae]
MTATSERVPGRPTGRPRGGAWRERLTTGRPVGDPLRDRGQSTIEYVGIVVVVVAIIGSVVLAVSPVAQALVARLVCEVSSLGQADCSTPTTRDPGTDAPDDDEPSWWCDNVGWFCSDPQDEEETKDDEPSWWCETLGWFCPEDPTEDPTDDPTSTPTPTGHPTDPSNGLPVVDGVTIPEGLDPDGEAVRTLLETERGREMLQWLADNGISIKDSSRGSYWDGTDVYIDAGHTPLETVRTLVHEVNHAQSDRAGQSPDIDQDSRDDYVNGMLDEETRGVVEEILAARELEDAGVKMPTDVSDDTYWDAYDAAVKAGRTGAQARDAGFAAVRNLFLDGTYVTSNTGDPYDDYYGDAWDDRH